MTSQVYMTYLFLLKTKVPLSLIASIFQRNTLLGLTEIEKEFLFKAELLCLYKYASTNAVEIFRFIRRYIP